MHNDSRPRWWCNYVASKRGLWCSRALENAFGPSWTRAPEYHLDSSNVPQVRCWLCPTVHSTWRTTKIGSREWVESVLWHNPEYHWSMLAVPLRNFKPNTVNTEPNEASNSPCCQDNYFVTGENVETMRHIELGTRMFHNNIVQWQVTMNFELWVDSGRATCVNEHIGKLEKKNNIICLQLSTNPSISIQAKTIAAEILSWTSWVDNLRERNAGNK